MSLGQSCDEYWNGNPAWSRYYVKANDLKTENRNQISWLNGLYVYDAFAVVLSNAFSKKGSKKEKYLEKPIRITPMTDEEKKAEERKKMKEMTDALLKMSANTKSNK